MVELQVMGVTRRKGLLDARAPHSHRLCIMSHQLSLKMADRRTARVGLRKTGRQSRNANSFHWQLFTHWHAQCPRPSAKCNWCYDCYGLIIALPTRASSSHSRSVVVYFQTSLFSHSTCTHMYGYIYDPWRDRSLIASCHHTRSPILTTGIPVLPAREKAFGMCTWAAMSFQIDMVVRSRRICLLAINDKYCIRSL